MTDSPKLPKDEATPDGKPLRRRLFVLKLAALGGATTATAACVPVQPVYAPGRVAISDADPSDPPGRGRGGHRGSGATDNDPSDAPGFGRGGQRFSGPSDNDPSDPPGRGRGGFRGSGVSDSDPSDAPGRGRGGFRRGASDSDPYDAPGRGRRGW